MKSDPAPALLKFYDAIWAVALPLLQRHARAGAAFRQRTLSGASLPRADLWIQAASAGEAYLAGALAAELKPRQPLRILLTTNTPQGFEILENSLAGANAAACHPLLSAHIRYLPFDRPRIMGQAVAQARPRVTVLLETELWPAMLYYLKQSGCPVLLINGRLTRRSLRRYGACASPWRCLAPDRIEAISREDAHRFGRLFPDSPIGVTNNLKFDRIRLSGGSAARQDLLSGLLAEDAPLVILASIRQPEEEDTAWVLARILSRRPDAQIALVPRHMHRVPAWADRLAAGGWTWQLRSRLMGAAAPGTVILWDTFGELASLYHRGRAVFVGGSLKPLGGQNFLEPLTRGLKPVIGPHWDNFKWVGGELFRQGLIRQFADREGVAERLLRDLSAPAERDAVMAAALAFIRRRQGGTARSCRLIEGYLHASSHRR